MSYRFRTPRRAEIYRSYHELVKAGVRPRDIEAAFERGDLENLHEDIAEKFHFFLGDGIHHGMMNYGDLVIDEYFLSQVSNQLRRSVPALVDDFITKMFPKLTLMMESRNYTPLEAYFFQLMAEAVHVRQDRLHHTERVRRERQMQGWDAEVEEFD
jgi:hypothetical protein